MKSDSRSSSSSPTRRTPSCAARAGCTYGSKAISRAPKAAMRCANSTPMRPRPTTPTVLPAISTPVYLERFHSPALSAEEADAVLRATASSRATACSAAETMLEVGALTTMTPRAVAADTSTLSSPTPARATTRSAGAAAERLRVDLGGAAHDDRVRVGERGEQRRPVGAVDMPDIEVVGQHVDRGGSELLGDEHDGCHDLRRSLRAEHSGTSSRVRMACGRRERRRGTRRCASAVTPPMVGAAGPRHALSLT